MQKKIFSRSSRETKKIAAQLAKKILKEKNQFGHRAKVIALVGELGAGKTTFVQGFAKALGIRQRITSPTFLIFRKYKIPLNQLTKNQLLNFYHVDLYRVHSVKELKVLNFKNILHSPLNIVLIEWAEKIKKSLPSNTIWINFEYGKRPMERKIYIWQ